MKEQQILNADNEYSDLDGYLQDNGCKVILLVCDNSIQYFKIRTYFENLEERMGITVVKFSDFEPNPTYESVINGIEAFKSRQCDTIIAVGGGSAMDVAKCIKLFSNMDESINYLKQKVIPNRVKLIAMPTTAGTGSEATRFAVIYYNGEKQSITDESCIPSAVIFDASVLETLPEYQRKATMMDAFCHAIESFWSVNSTNESQRYSKQAIREILKYKDEYLANTEAGNAGMLHAANMAGRAINITQTTAGHAMCYKLTSLYKIAHGHAAALCVAKLFPYMLENMKKSADRRGEEYLRTMFERLGIVLGCENAELASKAFGQLMDELNFCIPTATEEEFSELCASVNPVRLKNNPIELDQAAIGYLYHQILK